MFADRRGIGDYAIERDQRADPRKDRQQRIIGDAGCDGDQPMLLQISIDTPENILPAFDRDLGRRFGIAAALALGGFWILRAIITHLARFSSRAEQPDFVNSSR